MAPATALPTPDAVQISVHAVEQYQQRVKPGLDIDAARSELEQLRAVSQVSTHAPVWLHAVREAPCYLLVGDAIVMPVLPQQAGGWIATTCVIKETLTPAGRQAKNTHKASLNSRKRAGRRARF